MDTFNLLNLLVGPLGQSFNVIKKRGKLFVESDFTELTETQYESYFKKVGKTSRKIYTIGYDKSSNEFEIVDELEKVSLLQASEFIRKTVGKDQSVSDTELIDKFASEFPFLTR